MKRTLIITAGLCMCWLSSPSYAQTSNSDNMILDQSSLASVDRAMKPILTQTFLAKPELRLNTPDIYNIGREKTYAGGDIKTAGKIALGAVLLALAALVLFLGSFFITYEPKD